MEGSSLDDMEGIRRRLREFKANEVKSLPLLPVPQAPQPTHYPETYVPTEKKTDALEEQIQAYLKRPVSIGPIQERFCVFGQVTKDMRPVIYDFEDDVEKNKPGIQMVRANPTGIAQLGRQVIPMISSGFSRKGAAAIFTLAYNATTPGSYHTEYLFPDVFELENWNDKRYDGFSDKILAVGNYTDPLTAMADPREEASIYAYIALSLLRLFTKSPGNYVLAFEHIRKGYSRFYGDEIKMTLPTPSEAAIKGLSEWFSIEPRAKQTLYRLLYLGNEPMTHMDLKRFLYEMHLSNTGMHLAGMFVNLGYLLNCNATVLLQAINTREFERQLECLIALLKLVQSPQAKYRRKMWRYGRIFDENFMADIQTKACAKLVYIFGCALKMVAPNTYANVLNIVQLADVSDVNKRKCEDIAQKLLEAIRAHHHKDTGEGEESRAILPDISGSQKPSPTPSPVRTTPANAEASSPSLGQVKRRSYTS